MEDRPLDLHMKIGSHEFDAPFGDRGSLLSNDSSMLFEQMPESVMKSLYAEIRGTRNVSYPLSVRGDRFTMGTDITILVLGYDAPKDRYYLVFELAPKRGS